MQQKLEKLLDDGGEAVEKAGNDVCAWEGEEACASNSMMLRCMPLLSRLGTWNVLLIFHHFCFCSQGPALFPEVMDRSTADIAEGALPLHTWVEGLIEAQYANKGLCISKYPPHHHSGCGLTLYLQVTC